MILHVLHSLLLHGVLPVGVGGAVLFNPTQTSSSWGGMYTSGRWSLVPSVLVSGFTHTKHKVHGVSYLVGDVHIGCFLTIPISPFLAATMRSVS